MKAFRFSALIILLVFGYLNGIHAQGVDKAKMQLGAPLQSKIAKHNIELANAPSITLTSKNSFYLQFISSDNEVEVNATQTKLLNKELKGLEIPVITTTAKFKTLAEGDFQILAYFPEYQWNTFIESVNMQQPILFNCMLVSYTDSKKPNHILIVTGFNQ